MTSIETAIQIDLASGILTFDTEAADLHNLVEQGYTAAIKDKWNILLERLREVHPAKYENWQDKISLLSTDGFHPSFLKPEFTDKLMNYKPKYFDWVINMLDGYLDAEIAKVTGKFDINKYKQLWTCNGDFLLTYDPGTQTFHSFNSFMFSDRTFMDFFSPACFDDNNKEDIGREPNVTVGPFEIDEAIGIGELMMESISPLDDQFSAPLQLIDRCTDVIVMKKYSGDEYFYSSSNGAYIGTSYLVNPHVANAEMIINALVHEATHSLILAIDVCDQWMPGHNDPRAEQRIASHWTGRPLPIRSYLQAQFVWFGLYNFWKHAVDKKIYNQLYAAERLTYISNGFRKMQPSVLEEIGIDAKAVETIRLMQQQVLQHAG